MRFVYDTDVSGGGTTATAAAIDTSGVTNPAPQAVYQNERDMGTSPTRSPGSRPGIVTRCGCTLPN